MMSIEHHVEPGKAIGGVAPEPLPVVMHAFARDASRPVGSLEYHLAIVAVALVALGLLIQTRATLNLLSTRSPSQAAIGSLLFGLAPLAVGTGMLIGMLAAARYL